MHPTKTSNLTCGSRVFTMLNKAGKFMVGIGIILEHLRTGQILLLKRSSDTDFAANMWDNVGGRMNQFETPEAALRREVREETGLMDLSIIKPIHVSHYFRGKRAAENEIVVITYWCQSATQEINLSREHEDFVWIRPSEALEFVEDPVLKKIIHCFLEEKPHSA